MLMDKCSIRTKPGCFYYNENMSILLLLLLTFTVVVVASLLYYSVLFQTYIAVNSGFVAAVYGTNGGD